MANLENTANYAGDIDAQAAWVLLKSDPTAQLVDVRTTAEWAFVGLPDLSSLDRDTHRVEWQGYPDMDRNEQFVVQTRAQLEAAGASSDTPILFLCRSGARSRAAASAMAAAGFRRAFNIAGGFEGDLDEQRHRGARNGWKALGLPWRQS